MTVELARHLVRSGVLSPEQVEAALLRALSAGIPFTRALVDHSPEVARLVDRELERLGGSALPSVRLARELARDLPRGLCSRLLAVPIGRDPATGAVEVAAADPLDPHVADELSFHLATPVKVFRAALSEVEAALEALPFTPSAPPSWSPMDEEYDERTPAFGTSRGRMPVAPLGRLGSRGDSPPETRRYPDPVLGRPLIVPSDPPIPLVRRTIPAGTPDVRGRRELRRREHTFPGVGDAPRVDLSDLAHDEGGEPVIGLIRPKLPTLDSGWGGPPPESPIPPAAESGSTSPPTLPVADAPPVEVPPGREAVLDESLHALAGVETPDAVVDVLASGAASLASSVMVFATRGSTLKGRAGRGLAEPDRVRELTIRRSGASVFDLALDEGSYRGKLSVSEAHGELLALLGTVPEEVVIQVVNVSERPALVLLLAGVDGLDETLALVQKLARKAGFALERIVLSRKL